MNKTELRIGNKVLYNGVVCYVYSIFESIARLQPPNERSTTAKLEKVMPIPLTPELLERCGFQKTGNMYIISLDVLGTKMAFDTLDNSVLIREGTEEVELAIEMKYLHTMQNLYFALTNTELSIK